MHYIRCVTIHPCEAIYIGRGPHRQQSIMISLARPERHSKRPVVTNAIATSSATSIKIHHADDVKHEMRAYEEKRGC